MSWFNNILSLGRQLYPTGRAFKMPDKSWLSTLNYALALREHKAFTDAVKIHNSILPDNASFSAEDASDWERRLGLIDGTGKNIEDRKLAIKRKMNHPGTIKARQHFMYVQGQLQAAGFDVYVHENRFDDGMGGYVTQNPLTITGGVGFDDLQHGEVQHGVAQHGGNYSNICVNYIDEVQDSQFNVGANLRSTFFIGGETLGDFAFIPLIRKDEFRQLILKLKPTQTVAYLFVSYTS